MTTPWIRTIEMSRTVSRSIAMLAVQKGVVVLILIFTMVIKEREKETVRVVKALVVVVEKRKNTIGHTKSNEINCICNC